jgi:hypothetical protein
MYKLFQFSIFCLMTLIVGQTTVSASESNWDEYTRKDELTGKNSEPFLMYKVGIPGTTKGKLELQVVCSNSMVTGFSHPHHVTNNTNLKSDDKTRLINHVITFFDSPLLQTNGYPSSVFRQLNMDEKTVYDVVYQKSNNYTNVYFLTIFSINTMTDYSNLPRRQEVVFVDGKKIIIDFGQRYFYYVKSCFTSRSCRLNNDCSR